VLARDPLCKIAKICGGTAASTDADHIVPAEQYVAQHGGDERYFFDVSNLQGACHADHTAKTRAGG
jgi:5-methylcytosine-specific restriction protein A